MKCILPTQPVKRQAANNSVIVDNEVDFTETISDIDPISKRPFKEPVKNTVCGHIYDKDSIKQLIALGNRVRYDYLVKHLPIFSIAIFLFVDVRLLDALTEVRFN